MNKKRLAASHGLCNPSVKHAGTGLVPNLGLLNGLVFPDFFWGLMPPASPSQSGSQNPLGVQSIDPSKQDWTRHAVEFGNHVVIATQQQRLIAGIRGWIGRGDAHLITLSSSAIK